jgi:NADP-dependent 3-hydroxy acid dehydrogenase YdfG
MKRLEELAKYRTDLLKGKRVIITGCGYKSVEHRFYDITSDQECHDSLTIDGIEMKINIGTAIAGVLAINGATVHMVSSSEDKLRRIKKGLDDILGRTNLVEYSSENLLEKNCVDDFVDKLPKDKTLYWVQSLGLGAGSYKVKDDNPYLPEEQVPLELLKAELGIVVSSEMMLKRLLPIFRKQNESRIAVISSMSAIRGYSYGAAHCSAKGAIDRWANVIMNGKYKENIFISTIRPGAVDTGMYDNPVVQEAIKDISDEYNGIWRKQITLAPPTTVGEVVKLVFTTPAHLLSVNLVAKGQFTNEGS